MSIEWYNGKVFVLDSTAGEGTNLFGIAPPTGGSKPPQLRIDIDAIGLVTLTLLSGGGTRPFHPTARYIDGDHFESATYPDPLNDIIIGHFDFGDPKEQQLFLMWVRPDPKAPDKMLRLGFFIFDHDSRFSTGSGPMIPGIGQQNGGGTGTGPH